VTFQERNVAAYLSLFLLALFVMVFVHQSPTFAGSLPGHMIGIGGALVMFMTLAYPFPKRILKKRGRQNPLTKHILYGLTGSCLAIIHSAHKFGSTIGLILLATTFLVVMSGIIGFFLFRKVSRTVKDQSSDLDLLRKRFEEQEENVKACIPRLRSGAMFMPLQDSNNENEQEMERKCQEVMDIAYSIVDLHYTVKVFSKLKALFSMWTGVHYFLALCLFSILIVHVLMVFYYGIRWL